jgi:Amt family ammonium transporter
LRKNKALRIMDSLMPENSLTNLGLAFLIPIGFALIAASGLPAERARHAAIVFLASLGLAVVGYVAVGFAFQFGGVGLAFDRPGLDGLIWEWSALGPTWGSGWGMAGLVGWGLTGPAATPAAYALALANLPWVITAALIPLATLRGRAPAWATGLLGLLMGAVIYPLAGNWIWGGGWLANLGDTLGMGHGFVDAAGGGLVHLLGAATALAGILALLPRRPRSAKSGEVVPLPSNRFPLLVLLGAVALLIGGLGWTLVNPLLPRQTLDLSRLALNGILAAASGALLSLAYTWLVAGSPDPLMAARGLATAAIAAVAFAPFVPPWVALAVGAVSGLLTPLAIFVVGRLLRWEDPAAVLTMHGLGGALGLLAVGLFADGTAGRGWNGVGAASYLGVAGQGVTGLLAAAGYQPDWPGQMQAQGVGLAALALFGFFAAWLCVAPPALLVHLLRPRPIARRSIAPAEPVVATAGAEANTPDQAPAFEPPSPIATQTLANASIAEEAPLAASAAPVITEVKIQAITGEGPVSAPMVPIIAEAVTGPGVSTVASTATPPASLDVVTPPDSGM